MEVGMKTYDFDVFLQKQLKDPKVKKAYDELADEYDLAAQVIRFRIGRNLTQAQLARLVGTSQPAIARLESGNHSNVTLSFLFRVAKALDLKPELKFRTVKAKRRTASSLGTSAKSPTSRRIGKLK
jgi:DNA-binding XRE family transcriptional regulator